MLSMTSSPLPPASKGLCYHAEKIVALGGCHAADPWFEEPVKAPHAVAALSLISFVVAGCSRKAAEPRPVEPRLTGGSAYASCSTDGETAGLIPPVVCRDPLHPRQEDRTPRKGPAVRGPRAQDRVLGLDTLYVNATMLLLVFGMRTASALYFEAALVIGMLGFVSSAALAKFLLRGEVIE